jgi:hypothetical protein
MLLVSGSQVGAGSHAQSGTSLGQAQPLGAHCSVHAWHTMPSAHCASLVHDAGVHALSSMVSHG